MECPTYSAICRAVDPNQEKAAESTLVGFGRFRISVLTSMESVAETGGNVDDHYKLTEHDEETGEPYDVCPSCSDDWPCVYGKLEAAQEENRRFRSLLDSTEYVLEWIFDHCDDPKLYRCDCSEDGGYMEWDTNAYIHTDRCSAGMDDSMGALRDQIRQALGKAVIDV